MTVRLRLDLAYDGGRFAGWARQPGLRTVQGELEAALTTVLAAPGLSVVCAGRTDAGVHARGQVCHLDLPVDSFAVPARSRAHNRAAGRDGTDATAWLCRRLNSLLPADVAVPVVTVAPPGFDARFSAVYRRYAYRLADSEAGVDPLRRAEVCRWRRRLDVDAMVQATTALLGLHDFAAFCRARVGATTIRELTNLDCVRTGHRDGVIEIGVQADAFCHNMVRALVGALVAIGEGRHEPAWAAGLLRAGRRDPGVRVLPANGLTLEQVGYPPAPDLAARARTARAVRTLPGVASPGSPPAPA